MKGLLLSAWLLGSLPIFAITPDTTVTSFEIHVKRKASENPLGFNTTTIDRAKLYNSVIQRIQKKISTAAFSSLHEPLVLLKFEEYINQKGPHHTDEITYGEERSLKSHHYNYFVKIYGFLNTRTALNPFQNTTFTLKVCVFDANGRLVAKGRSKSSGKNIEQLGIQTTAEGRERTITEEEFIDLVSEAADNLDIHI